MKRALCLIASFFLYGTAATAQDSLLADVNGDGQVRILAFGDSITFGVGDRLPPGAFVLSIPFTDVEGGYPERLETLLQLPVDNEGVPGEEVTLGGYLRFPQLLTRSSADTVILLEGLNDAFWRRSPDDVRRSFQRMINVSRALGRQVVLATLPIPCCNRLGSRLFGGVYSGDITSLAQQNGIALADVERAWRSTCSDINSCDLLNLPEGLHPNTRGYDVIAQVFASTLLGVNIFAADGAVLLEQALGLSEGSVIVRPDEEAPQS